MIGIHPNEFWSMNAWQLRVCLAAHSELHDILHRHDLAIAWHQANFQRAGKLPPLKTILNRLKQPMENAPNGDIISIMKSQLVRRGQ